MGHSVQAPLHIVFESGARCPPGMPKGRQLTRRIGRAQGWDARDRRCGGAVGKVCERREILVLVGPGPVAR